MRIGLTSFEDNALAGTQYPDASGKRRATPGGKAAGWRDLLGKAIEHEVLPRLLTALKGEAQDDLPVLPGGIDEAAVAAFAALVIDDDLERLRAVADRFILHTGSREALLTQLLTPTARLLGEMWNQDACDFMTVTLGVYRLDQIVKETAVAGTDIPLSLGFDHRILLLPAPGEQHNFGLSMVADAFREGGWCVRSAPAATRTQLVRLVKDEWFDVIGLSIAAERWLKGLPACIRAVRAASCNAGVFVTVGGRAIINHAERTRFLGADGFAADAGEALLQANNYMEMAVTGRFCQFKTKLGDVSRAL